MYTILTRLGFQDDILLHFPKLDVILQIYIINCAVIRLKPNVFDTIRNKLRAIDYVAQLANVNQSWSTNPSLAAIVAYAKKRNKSKECDHQGAHPAPDHTVCVLHQGVRRPGPQ